MTGQNGSSPALFVWDAETCDKVQRIKLKKGARGISCVGFSSDGKYIACADMHNDHNVRTYSVSNGQCVYEDKGGPDKIYDLCWSKSECCFATGGKNHIKFWWPEKRESKKGIFCGKGKLTSFACVGYGQETCYSGGCNALIYKWGGRSCQGTIKAHSSGFICTINVNGGKIVSGGRDGQIIVIDEASFNIEHKINMGGLVRAVDYNGTNIVAGLRSGDIKVMDLDGSNQKQIMASHSDGEVWTCEELSDGRILTAGDDNKVLCWEANPSVDNIAKCTEVSSENRKAPKGGASTLSPLPASQQSRSAVVLPDGSSVAIARNDGYVAIRQMGSNNDTTVLKDSKEWIEVMKVSPCKTYLAVGSHDNTIYVYNISDWSLVGKCTAHNSFICNLDWDEESKYIRSVCGAHELLFHTIPDCQQDKGGASATTGTKWATNSCKFGWLVDGVFPPGTSGPHVNGVDISADQKYVMTADNYGLVNLYNNPCRQGSKAVSFAGHSEHVQRAYFTKAGTGVISVGGYDQTLMRWDLQE